MYRMTKVYNCYSTMIAGAVVSFSSDDYMVMESSGTVQVAVLRSGNTEEQNVVTVHSRALESSASGLLSPNTV